jgi:betaine reductase
MLLAKDCKGESFTTEYPMPVFDRVDPANPAIKDITKAKIALVSSGGPVPKGNPDHIESSSAPSTVSTAWKELTILLPANGETAHGGYDPVYANEDLDRVLPVDVLREMAANGEIGSLHKYWYATVGNGTSVANARKFAAEIAQRSVGKPEWMRLFSPLPEGPVLVAVQRWSKKLKNRPAGGAYVYGSSYFSHGRC